MEERFLDAVFLRDNAGAGLVGWWAGLPNDTKDPYGLIIRITAEHGRYVARSFSPRQLATASVGIPLFEIFLTVNKKGEYKQQAVYLKRRSVFQDTSMSPKTSGTTSHLDVVPGAKVKVVKVTSPGKVDQDFVSKSDNDQERDKIEMDTDNGVIDSDRRSEIAVKVVVGGLVQKLSGNVPAIESLRVPAKLVKKGHLAFSFSIEKDVSQQDTSLKAKGLIDRKAKVQGQRTADEIMIDLAKFIGREKIPLKVLKDVGELINLTLSQVKNGQPLSGSTTFHRIEIAASPDPLNGLYIGTHGLYTSEVIHLKRKFGQWQGDSGTKEPSDLEFYEYVEAVKLTGDPYVPAGKVAFRARVGKRYQLPHNGLIPEEFGVVARYKGQGRLAEPGFRNPRWVDGELVILDGKYIKGGPVVGFVYWAPEYHFLVFFNQLRLQL
ncbi:hypothetical protein GOBAR_AA08107 [Gossypium barbadense]|uniref:Uncharacterized protein n=1 Tax=Gossypium barbadense TaxID=3634 RepID=A0A2P5YAC3_GOSBA|nr:hypothetical protein GOBAR_AA08107 [Gossypium barbadense]